MALYIGDKIPEILGTDQNGKTVKMSNFAGKKLALYFYPRDNTPGCTAQACSLRDGYTELLRAGYEVAGVSIDSETSHQKFIDKFSLPFPLIADTDKKTGRTVRRLAGEIHGGQNTWYRSYPPSLSMKRTLYGTSLR